MTSIDASMEFIRRNITLTLHKARFIECERTHPKMGSMADSLGIVQMI